MKDQTCDVCGEKFKNEQALGSHIRYKHSKKKGLGPDDPVDLKGDFQHILQDIGIRNRSETLTNIFFDAGADNIDNLEKILRMAGIADPARTLILARWSQRLGQDIPERFMKGKEKQGSDVFAAYDRLVEAEIRGLLLQDFRARIAKNKGEQNDSKNELSNKLDSILLELRLQRRKDKQQPPRHREYNDRFQWNDFYYPPYEKCRVCGYYIPVSRVPIGAVFGCPRCGKEYINELY